MLALSNVWCLLQRPAAHAADGGPLALGVWGVACNGSVKANDIGIAC